MVDDYLYKFWQVKSCCFTQVVKNEIMKIVMVNFGFVIRKRLVSQNIIDMSQLVNEIRQIEQLHKKKKKIFKEKNDEKEEKLASHLKIEG